MLSRRREQLDQVLPELSSTESLYLQPVSKVTTAVYIGSKKRNILATFMVKHVLKWQNSFFAELNESRF